MLEIKCPQCGASAPVEDVDPDTGMVTCRFCEAVFRADIPREELQRKPLPMGMPDHISVEDDGMRLRIERRWFSLSALGILVFAVFWNGIIWAVFVPNFGRIRFGSNGSFGSLFMLPFILIGLGMAVHGLASLVNRTTITVDDGEILIQHRPIPYPGQRLAAEDIQQLYTRQRVSTSSSSSGSRSSTITYELRAIMQEGREKKLLGGLPRAEQAQYIEQEVERFLRIKNRPVRGEYR